MDKAESQVLLQFSYATVNLPQSAPSAAVITDTFPIKGSKVCLYIADSSTREREKGKGESHCYHGSSSREQQRGDDVPKAPAR